MARRAGTPRDIHVDGNDYHWHVAPADSMPELRAGLRVWRAGSRGARHLHVTVNFFNAGTYFYLYLHAPEEKRDIFQTEPVRPRFVAAVIRAARAAGWDPDDTTPDRPPATPWPDPVDPDPDTLPAPDTVS